MIDYSSLSPEQLEDMYGAAAVVSETMRVLQKSETNVVGEILKTADKFVEWKHLPPKDVYDRKTHSQYYYHAHSKSKDGKGLHDDEHGHFHTFIRGKGIPQDIKPLPLEGYDPKMAISKVNTHIIGIGMNAMGTPIRLFTVNRWVTGETWHKAEDVISLLERYEIDDVRPSWAVNLWVSSMIALYRPQIAELLRKRDAQIEIWKTEHPESYVYENRDLEVASSLEINLAAHIEAIEAAMAA